FTMHMSCAENPVYELGAGHTEWDTFSFSAGCSAPAGQLDGFLADCAAVLASFGPGPNWLDAEVADFIANQELQLQMIGQTLDRVFKLQWQSTMLQNRTTAEIGHGWWNVLGGRVDVQAADGTGPIFNIPETNRYYCRANDPEHDVLGTDNPYDLNLCGTRLKRVNPPAGE